jgi:hypothetical protein
MLGSRGKKCIPFFFLFVYSTVTPNVTNPFLGFKFVTRPETTEETADDEEGNRTPKEVAELDDVGTGNWVDFLCGICDDLPN